MTATKKKLSETGLNPRQEMFCQLFASDREFFGNGVQSYIEAYDPDTSAKNWYLAARVSASRLLTNTNILRRINELFEESGLNDQFVDKQLEKLITQDADFTNKMAAIKEYNKLKQRITEKIDVAMSEKPKPLFDRSSHDSPDDGAKKNPAAKKAA
jgi:hypothetical protein